VVVQVLAVTQQEGAELRTAEVMGFPVATGAREEILQWLLRRLAARQSTHVVTLNPEMVLLDRRGGPGAEFLHRADLYVADGIGIVWAAKRTAGLELPRYPGVDLALHLLAELAESGGRVFLLGGAPGVAEQAAGNLTQRLPGLNIAGTRDGFFAPGGDAEVADQIAGTKADLLLVGMGCPRQEGFISMQRDRLGAAVSIGVGGALDVFAGVKRRAPRWIQAAGMEWAYRGLSDPARLKRMVALPRFVSLVLTEGRRA
jgi:N-acetylglucosaminyldiphosphoundecaprenol N-acetyl-beta-D-mannosaminyltransferase